MIFPRFVPEQLEKMVKYLNDGLSRLTFSENFDSNTFKNVIILANSSKSFSHNFKSVPIGKVIMKTNGLITDGLYTIDQIILDNNNAFDVTITFVIMR